MKTLRDAPKDQEVWVYPGLHDADADETVSVAQWYGEWRSYSLEITFPENTPYRTREEMIAFLTYSEPSPWVKCSERMPEEGTEVWWAHRGSVFSKFTFCFGKFGIWEGGEFIPATHEPDDLWCYRVPPPLPEVSK